MTLLEKARLGRETALASLAKRDEDTTNVVSIFDFATEKSEPQKPAAPIPAFRSIRSEGHVLRLAA